MTTILVKTTIRTSGGGIESNEPEVMTGQGTRSEVLDDAVNYLLGNIEGRQFISFQPASGPHVIIPTARIVSILLEIHE